MTANMLLIKSILFLSLFLTIQAQDDEYLQKVMAELEIANLELQDDCENVAKTIKTSLITNTFQEKIKVRETHAELLKILSENVRPLEDDVPPELLKNWTLLVKSGDGLLREQDWSTLVTFDVNNDQSMHSATIHCKNDSQDCQYVKRGYDDILENSKNQTVLKKSWSAWQTLLSWKKNQFPNVLNLVPKAALQNGIDDPKSYWEVLSEKEDAYTLADQMWEQIQPLYFNLQNFVKRRLFHFYNITDTEGQIPVYLLGSQFGNDWSQIADILLPHPQILHEAEVFLNKTKIKDVYKLAEELTQTMSLGSLGPKFWDNSRFNMTFCENHVVSFCVAEHSELFACEKVSWPSYLDAFEVAMDIALRNVDYLSLARSDLRYSAVDEAVKGLGAILAVENLRTTGIWGSHFFSGDSSPNVNEMAQRLLIALRVLPKLPFYLAADKFRLHLLERGFDKLEEHWWELRKEYQGVQGVFNNETDFLFDSYFTSNKPYLSKFLGTILQFQFFDYYKSDWEYANQSTADNIGKDENFLNMLRERSITEWPSVIVNHHSIYDLSATALLDYFAPLEEYLQSAPLEQAPLTTPKPATTTTTEASKIIETTLISEEVPVLVKKVEESTEPPLRPKHEHVEENLEGPNHVMENISMYIGLALLVAVIAIIVFVIVTKRMKKKRTNNRRFET